MRVNLGCGTSYLDGWLNVDGNPEVRADVYSDAFEFVRQYGSEVTELYMGHFLEHLLPASAVALLKLMREHLPAGAEISAVVPDMPKVFEAYDSGEMTNRWLNERFVYSYEQPSHHVWCYDVESLQSVFVEAGLADVEEIDPLTWPPVWWKAGPESRWQCGVRAQVPPQGASVESSVDPDAALAREYPVPVATPITRHPATANDQLLARIRDLEQRLDLEGSQHSSSSPGDAPPTPAGLRGVLHMLRSGAAHPALDRVLPRGGRRRAAARFGIETARGSKQLVEHVRTEWAKAGLRPPRPPSYSTWCKEHAAPRARLIAQREASRRAVEPVEIHFIVLGEADVAGLRATLRSLQAQTWSHWRASVVMTQEPHPLPVDDPRVRIVVPDADDLPEKANFVVGADAGRDFVAFVESGDRLAPDCAFEVAEAAATDPLVDLVYWDDDLLEARGKRSDPRFRPSWSPETLLGSDYIGRAFAVRERRFQAVAGLREGLDAGVWWDLVLRCDLTPDRVSRVPRVLSHVRRRAAVVPDEKLRVVSEHLERRAIPADATLERDEVRITWDVPLPRATIIIPTRHNRALLDRCLAGLGATEYPEFDVVVVDNGERSPENEAWYAELEFGRDLRVEWWDEPFNYSAVNNFGAARASGEVLVFVNDDTEFPDPTWLRELSSWAVRPEIGVAGLQLLDAEGRIQHGGVVLGLHGFADNLFVGMAPGAPSLLGSTSSYRNVLAVTGACLAVRSSLFEEIGGFDERFHLCGSDVVLGLDAVLLGKRNVCSPYGGVRHLESVTRGTFVPREDFFASYWRYQRWVLGGDPYFSPSLSLESSQPQLRSRFEREPNERFGESLDRTLTVFRQRADDAQVDYLARHCRATDADVRAVHGLHASNREPSAPGSINWFFPEFDSPFYGGINTALRMAEHLARTHGVDNRFVVYAGEQNEEFHRSAISAAFPSLANAPIEFDVSMRGDGVSPADVSIATLWATAYSVAHFQDTRKKFYLVQDFEPMFYPAGTMYALAEESYRLGLYGICNTKNLLDLYERYGGRGTSFMPAVDSSVFHADGRVVRGPDDPVTVFVYARPGHWRNCWELASEALQELKQELGDRVRILTAGSWARPEDVGTGIRHLGLLDYRETGSLYRSCDIGVALTVSEHPSYLPLELMACGVPVVAFDNPAGHWLLRDGENCKLARRTPDDLALALERLVLDPQLRADLSSRASRDIAESFGSWDKALSGIYEYLTDPEGGTTAR